MKGSCNTPNCPYSHSKSAIKAFYEEKLAAVTADGKKIDSKDSGKERTPQPKSILPRPQQHQQQDQKPRSRYAMVDGRESSVEESSSALVTSARANRSGNDHARGGDSDDF